MYEKPQAAESSPVLELFWLDLSAFGRNFDFAVWFLSTCLLQKPCFWVYFTSVFWKMSRFRRNSMYLSCSDNFKTCFWIVESRLCLLAFVHENRRSLLSLLTFNRVPTRTGKPGKPGKMGRHFPVREKSGNFEQTGKVRENHRKYWKTQGISDKYYFLFFSDI